MTINEILGGGQLKLRGMGHRRSDRHAREDSAGDALATAQRRRQRNEHDAGVGGDDDRGVGRCQRAEREGDGEDRGCDRDRVADEASPNTDVSEHPGSTFVPVSETVPGES
jgi:hypothetical protein